MHSHKWQGAGGYLYFWQNQEASTLRSYTSSLSRRHWKGRLSWAPVPLQDRMLDHPGPFSVCILDRVPSLLAWPHHTFSQNTWLLFRFQATYFVFIFIAFIFLLCLHIGFMHHFCFDQLADKKKKYNDPSIVRAQDHPNPRVATLLCDFIAVQTALSPYYRK